jgi:hypothetical protein
MDFRSFWSIRNLKKELNDRASEAKTLQSDMEALKLTQASTKALATQVAEIQAEITQALKTLDDAPKGDLSKLTKVELMDSLRDKQSQLQALRTSFEIESKSRDLDSSHQKDVIDALYKALAARWSKLQIFAGIFTSLSLLMLGYEWVKRGEFDTDLREAAKAEAQMVTQRDRTANSLAAIYFYETGLYDSEFSLFLALNAEASRNYPLAEMRTDRLITKNAAVLDYLLLARKSDIFELHVKPPEEIAQRSTQGDSPSNPDAGTPNEYNGQPLPSLLISSLERIESQAYALKTRILYKMIQDETDEGQKDRLRSEMQAVNKKILDHKHDEQWQMARVEAHRFTAFLLEDDIAKLQDEITKAEKLSAGAKEVHDKNAQITQLQAQRNHEYELATLDDDEQKIDLLNEGEDLLENDQWTEGAARISEFLQDPQRTALYQKLIGDFMSAACDLLAGSAQPAYNKATQEWLTDDASRWNDFVKKFDHGDKKGGYHPAKGFNGFGSQRFFFTQLQQYSTRLQTKLQQKVGLNKAKAFDATLKEIIAFSVAK